MYHAFVDLEKAFDRVPREVVFWCLRRKGVSEKLIRLVQMMCKDAKTTVQTANGETEKFEVKVGVHQGSGLSPVIFITVLDELSKNIKNQNRNCYNECER